MDACPSTLYVVFYAEALSQADRYSRSPAICVSEIKCDGNGLGLTVTGLTLKNKLSKNLYCSKVLFPFFKYLTNWLGWFLKFFYTDVDILRNYFCQHWIDAVDTVGQVILVAIKTWKRSYPVIHHHNYYNLNTQLQQQHLIVSRQSQNWQVEWYTWKKHCWNATRLGTLDLFCFLIYINDCTLNVK
jgi:hypothetical protein